MFQDKLNDALRMYQVRVLRIEHVYTNWGVSFYAAHVHGLASDCRQVRGFPWKNPSRIKEYPWSNACVSTLPGNRVQVRGPHFVVTVHAFSA